MEYKDIFLIYECYFLLGLLWTFMYSALPSMDAINPILVDSQYNKHIKCFVLFWQGLNSLFIDIYKKEMHCEKDVASSMLPSKFYQSPSTEI